MCPRLVGLITSLAAVFGSCMPPSDSGQRRRQADLAHGRIAIKPNGTVQEEGSAGLHELSRGNERAGVLYAPTTYRPERPMPLVVMLHGAGGTPRRALDLARAHADRIGFIVLAPGSAAATWDIIATSRYGADVRTLNAALDQAFGRYSVDPDRIGIAGFSDGASYALSLGLANGDLFNSVVAFSPGFTAALRHVGKPRIFVSHGVEDRVLPIDKCSRRIVPQLRSEGYAVDYREFPGGHTIPEEIALAGMASMSRGSSDVASKDSGS